MKSFKEFLTESHKTYKFKVRVAGELPEGFANRLEMNLKKYDIANVSAGKKTPIQETPLDFPQLQNCEVTHYEVELNYPATSYILERYLADTCNVPHSHISVRGENDPIDQIQKPAPETPYETLLDKEDMGGESAQDKVGSNRTMDLLKELEAARKEREIDPIREVKAGDSKDIDNKENAKSVIGS